MSVINFARFRPLVLPPQAKGEIFVNYELPDARSLARSLRPFVGRRVLLVGGGSSHWHYWPCVLRRVSVSITHRCQRDARGYVIRDRTRPGSRDWIPDRTRPKIASVSAHLGGKGLPTAHPMIGSWSLLVPTRQAQRLKGGAV